MARIWVERSTGLAIRNGRKFPGIAHEFIDVTDKPHPTIDARPRTAFVVEYAAADHACRPEGQTPMAAKPPYRVPLMSEIAALPWNGLNAISTFSGCGGSSLGYRMAGFRVLWANEFVQAARDCYTANKASHTILDQRDIRQVQPEDILTAIGLKQGEVDLFDGSPPCSSFSTAGRREAGWGKARSYSDTIQRVDDLFGEFVRLVRGVQPKTFVAENVSGLVKGSAKGHFLETLAALKACGYRVEARVLDAQWLGVPQARQRLIFQGVRLDLGADPAFPAPLAYRYTVRDALPHIIRPGEPFEPRMIVGNEAFEPVWGTLDHPSPTILASSMRTSGMIEVKTDQPKAERRKFTIAELRRICGFPDDFALVGTYQQQWERLGRAVPPVMMAAMASAVRDRVLKPAAAASVTNGSEALGAKKRRSA